MNLVLSLQNVVLKVPNVTKPILENFSLDVFQGDFLIILGHNGSGKSSLMHLINGTYRINSGSMQLLKQDLDLLSFYEISKHVTMLTQDLSQSTFANLTVLENCLLAEKRKNQSPLNKRDLIAHLYSFLPELKNKLHMPVRKLSGGQRQILALAMCLLSSPQLFLLDEHTSALDPIMAEKVMELTLKFIEKEKLTTLMTTHNLDHVKKYGNRLIAIQNGVKIFEANEEEKNRLTVDDLMQIYSLAYYI